MIKAHYLLDEVCCQNARGIHAIARARRLVTCFFAFVLSLVILPASGSCQNFVDLNSVSEQLITFNANRGGDVLIYISFPKWFSRTAGYVPVTIRVVPAKGAVLRTEGVLSISVNCSSYYSEDGPKSVIDIPLEKGVPSISKEALINLHDNNSISVHARLNGRKLPGQMANFYNGSANPGEYRTLTVISDATAVQSRRRAAMEEMAATDKWYSRLEASEMRSIGGVYADAAKFPTNWLYLNGVEQISIEAEDIPRMSPDSAACLNNYVLAGGFLIINNVRSVSEVTNRIPLALQRTMVFVQPKQKLNQTNRPTVFSLSDLETSLDPLEGTVWDSFQMDSARASLNPNYRRTQVVYQPSIYVNDIYDSVHNLWLSLVNVGSSYVDLRLSGATHVASTFFDSFYQYQRSDNGGQDTLAAPVSIGHGFGIVHLTSGSRKEKLALMPDSANFRDRNRLNRIGRFGNGIGEDFWGWLIPSVGRTPVVPFLVFVVLFVGGVVPGLMIWCNRHKRRVWLVVAMPIMAFLFTVMLFTYGVLKDGFGATGRSRSLAYVDKEGNGIAWSRQSYFAAAVPAGGVTVQPETQFVRLNPDAEKAESEFRHQEDSQNFRGYVPPRQQAQFSATHPLSKLAVVQRGTQVDNVLNEKAVINAMDTDWKLAVFINGNGDSFYARNVASKQSAIFEKATIDDVIAMQKEAYNSEKLLAPVDAPSGDQMSLNEFFRDIFSFNYYRVNNTNTIMEEDIWQNEIGFDLTDESYAQRMLPNTYILFLKEANYLDRCLENVVERNGLHTIVGRW